MGPGAIPENGGRGLHTCGEGSEQVGGGESQRQDPGPSDCCVLSQRQSRNQAWGPVSCGST